MLNEAMQSFGNKNEQSKQEGQPLKLNILNLLQRICWENMGREDLLIQKYTNLDKIETTAQLLDSIYVVDRTHPEISNTERDTIVLELISNFLKNQYAVTSELFALLAAQVSDVKRLEKTVASIATGGKSASTLEMVYNNQMEREKLRDNLDPEAQSLIDFVPPHAVAMTEGLEKIIRELAEPLIQGVFTNADPNSLKTVTHYYSPEIVKVLSKLIKDKMINQEPPAEFVTAFREIWDTIGLATKRFIIRSSSRAEDGGFAFPGVGDSTVVPMVEGWDSEDRFNYSVKVAMSVFASMFNEAGILARLTNVDLSTMLNFNPAKGEFMGALVQELAYPENQDIEGKSDIEIAKSFVSYYCFGDKGGWTVLTALWGNGAAIADSKASQSVVRINNEILANKNEYTNFTEPVKVSAKKWVVYCEREDAPGEQIVFKEYTLPPQGKALILEENVLDSDLPISERWKHYVELPLDTTSPFDEITGLEEELFSKLDVTRRIKGYEPDQEGVITINRDSDGAVNNTQPFLGNEVVQSRPITGGNKEGIQIVGKFPELPEADREAIIRNSIPVEASFHPGISEPSRMFTALSIPADTSQPLILLAKEVSMEAAPLYKLKGVVAALEAMLTGPTTHGAVTFGESDQPIISGVYIYDLLKLILGQDKYSQFLQINNQIEDVTSGSIDLNWLINVETDPSTLTDLQQQQVDMIFEALKNKKFILCAYQGLPGVEEGNFGGSSGFVIEVNSETQGYVDKLLEFQAVQEENKFNLGNFLQEKPLNKIKFGRNATELNNVEKMVRQGIEVNTLVRPNQSNTFTKYKDQLNFLDPKGSEIYDTFMQELEEELYALISPMKTSNYRVIAAALEEIWCKNQLGISDLREDFGDDKFSPINGASFVKAFPQIMKDVEMEAIKRVAARLQIEDAEKPKSEMRKIDFTLEFTKNSHEVNWFLDECVKSGLHLYPNIELGITLEGTRMVQDIANIRLPEGIDNLVISIGSNDLEAMSNNVSRSFAEGNVDTNKVDYLSATISMFKKKLSLILETENEKRQTIIDIITRLESVIPVIKDIDKNVKRLTVDGFPDISTMFRDQSQLISDIDKATRNAIFLMEKYAAFDRKINIRFDLCGGILSKNPLLLGHIVKAMNGLNGYLNFPTKSNQAKTVAEYAYWLEQNYDPERGWILPEFVELDLQYPEFAQALSTAGIY